MTKEFFLKIINRLSQVYGDKHYPDERIKIFWEWAKNKDHEILQIAVSDLIADCATAPLFSKIREEYLQAQKRLGRDGYLEKWIASQPDCSKCGKNGFIVAIEKTTKQVFAFKCNFCRIGEKTNPKYPVWLESLSSIYEPEWCTVTKKEIEATVNAAKESAALAAIKKVTDSVNFISE